MEKETYGDLEVRSAELDVLLIHVCNPNMELDLIIVALLTHWKSCLQHKIGQFIWIQDWVRLGACASDSHGRLLAKNLVLELIRGRWVTVEPIRATQSEFGRHCSIFRAEIGKL